MRWIKIKHNEGQDIINIQHVYKIEIRSDEVNQEIKGETAKENPAQYEIVMYDANSILATVFAWNTQAERDRVLKKLLETLDVANM
jgi:hypothetical protein